MGYAGCDSLKIIAAFVRVRTISAIRISSKSQFCMYKCVYPHFCGYAPQSEGKNFATHSFASTINFFK